MLDEAAVGGVGLGREGFHRFRPPVENRAGLAREPMEQGGLEHGGQGQLQVAGGEARQPVLVGHDLALFGDLDGPVDGAERLGEDRLVGGPTAAADRPPPPVEEAQGHPVLLSQVAQDALRLVDLPL